MKKSELLKRLTMTLLVLQWLSVSVVRGDATMPTVGILTGGKSWDPVLDGMKQGMEKLGYKQNKNINYLVEDSNGDVTDLVNRAKKLIDAKVDLIFTVPTAHAVAAMKATTTLPVVYAWASDPVRSGLIADYPSSKNNLTGVTSYTAPLSAKRLELLREIAPGVKKVLAPVSSQEVISRLALEVLEGAAKQFHIQVVRWEVKNKEDIEPFVTANYKVAADAIFYLPSVLLLDHIDTVIKRSTEQRLPLSVTSDDQVQRGALFTYGPDFKLVGAQSARLVAKVLKGEKPANIPSEIPEKFLFVANLSTAKSIGLKFPRKVLEKVDRVVE